MQRIVFIDDEVLITEGLKRIIDWNSYGISVAGSAQNAYDGIKLIEEVNPDIVIFDICMHGKDGLDMIEEVKRKGFDGYVILLSGYQEFDYAKRAIENRVFRYLLKPIDVDELTAAIKSIQKELEAKNAFSSEKGRMSEIVAYIDAHFHENIQLSNLADIFHFDVTHLSKLLKQKLGMNYIDYVTKLRINTAKKYIEETDMPFEEIFGYVGYNDVRRFREMFKKLVGMTPSEYKRTVKRLKETDEQNGKN